MVHQTVLTPRFQRADSLQHRVALWPHSTGVSKPGLFVNTRSVELNHRRHRPRGNSKLPFGIPLPGRSGQVLCFGLPVLLEEKSRNNRRADSYCSFCCRMAGVVNKQILYSCALTVWRTILLAYPGADEIIPCANKERSV